jgi:hypothetical protein
VLVLPTGKIYEVRRWDGTRWHDIHTKFHDDRFKHSSNIQIINSTISEAALLILLMGWSMPLRWPQVTRYAYQVSWRSV